MWQHDQLQETHGLEVTQPDPYRLPHPLYRCRYGGVIPPNACLSCNADLLGQMQSALCQQLTFTTCQ